MDSQSITHTRWNCTYHIVFIPKYRRKIMYGETKRDLVEIIKLMIFDRHPEYRSKWGDRHFWARGYYVSTVGNVNEETILNYIKEQEENDKLEDGIK